MSELMPSRADNSPVATVLDEVFHIEKGETETSPAGSRENMTVRSTKATS
jgi:hypothetical protein